MRPHQQGPNQVIKAVHVWYRTSNVGDFIASGNGDDGTLPEDQAIIVIVQIVAGIYLGS